MRESYLATPPIRPNVASDSCTPALAAIRDIFGAESASDNRSLVRRFLAGRGRGFPTADDLLPATS